MGYSLREALSLAVSNAGYDLLKCTHEQEAEPEL